MQENKSGCFSEYSVLAQPLPVGSESFVTIEYKGLAVFT